jgi:hypothetical protein
VRQIAHRDKGGEQRYWLERRDYVRNEFLEAWERMGSPSPHAAKEANSRKIISDKKNERKPVKASSGIFVSRPPPQNGVRHPKTESLCGQAWAVFDEITKQNYSTATLRESLELGRQRGLNEGNVRAEYYVWRKYHGISGHISK